MRRQIPILCAVLLVGLRLAADPGTDYKAGVDAEKAGDYEGALKAFESAKKALEGWAVLDRQMGNSFVRLSRVAEAIEAYDRYLAVKPDDAALRDYRDRLQASLGPVADPTPAAAPTPAPATEAFSDLSVSAAAEVSPSAAGAEGGVDGVTVYMKHNPHDYRKLRIGMEALTALGAGIDIGWRVNPHHEWGLGYGGGASGKASISVFHPRWRYHNARFLWDSFYEVGATVISAKDESYNYGGWGLNLGLGVERVSAWPFNWFWMVNLGYLNLSASPAGGTKSTAFGNANGVGVPYLIPFGLSWGLLF